MKQAIASIFQVGERHIEPVSEDMRGWGGRLNVDRGRSNHMRQRAA